MIRTAACLVALSLLELCHASSSGSTQPPNPTFNPGTYAIVVGVSEYAEGLRFPGVIDDCQKLEDFLKVTIGDTAMSSRMSIVEGRVSMKDVQNAFEAARKAQCETLLLYLGGMGELAAFESVGSYAIFGLTDFSGASVNEAPQLKPSWISSRQLASLVASVPHRRTVVIVDSNEASSVLYDLAARLDVAAKYGSGQYRPTHALFASTHDRAYDRPSYTSTFIEVATKGLASGRTASQIAADVDLLMGFRNRVSPATVQEPLFIGNGDKSRPLFTPIGSARNKPVLKVVEPATRADVTSLGKQSAPVRVTVDKVVSAVFIDGKPAVYENGQYVAIVSVGDKPKQIVVEAVSADGSRVNLGFKVVYDPKFVLKRFEAGDRRAYIVGIDRYQRFKRLYNASSDAKDIARVLRESYKYEVKELYDDDASLEGVYKMLASIPNSTKQNSQLLFYFAGHGYQEPKLADVSYICPVNAISEGVSCSSTMIHLTTLQNALASHGYQQVLLITDCCYSGSMRANPDGGFDRLWASMNPPTPIDELLERSFELQTKQFIAAGRREVPDGIGDHSPFTKALLASLTQDRTTEYATFSNLVSDLQSANLSPPVEHGRFLGSTASGEFVFIRPEAGR